MDEIGNNSYNLLSILLQYHIIITNKLKYSEHISVFMYHSILLDITVSTIKPVLSITKTIKLNISTSDNQELPLVLLLNY